jgi:hypothetical protein
MTTTTKIDDVRTVACLRDDYVFVSDSQDVEAVRDSIGRNAGELYDSFFCKVGEGEYVEVWGMVGIIPRLSKLVRRLL